MKQVLKSEVAIEDQIVLTISTDEQQNTDVFIWKHSKEFWYRGEMYDILEVLATGEINTYRCIHDVKESGIFKQLDFLVSNFLKSNSDEKKRSEFISSFFHKVYLKSEMQFSSYMPTGYIATFQYHRADSGPHLPAHFRPPSVSNFLT